MPSPPYQLRPFGPDDHAFLWALKQATMRPYVEATWGSWDLTEQEDYFRNGLSPGITHVISVDGRPAGRLDVTRQPTHIYLGVIELSPTLQGQGLGSTIVRDLQAEAEAAGIPLRLQVLKANPDAQRLYARLGFQVTSATPSHHLMAWTP